MDFNSHPRISKISKKENNTFTENISHGLIVFETLTTCVSLRPDNYYYKTVDVEN
jgi:hypothetical protein